MTPLAAALDAVPVVAVVRHDRAEDAAAIADAAIDGGIQVIEVTFTVPNAPELISAVRSRHPGAVVGAGTVLTTDQLDAAVVAGAEFAVSPVFDEEVAARAERRGMPFAPGAATPTEIARAASAGAALVKIYPAATLGPGFVRAVRDVLPTIPLMPTGGIRPADVEAWLDAGARAVGIAGALSSAWHHGGAAAVTDIARAAVAAAERKTS